MKILFTIILSMITTSALANLTPSIDSVVNSKAAFLCPGTKLVISCGNRVCEPHLKETVKSCAADCLKNVSVRSYNNITLCTGYTETQVPTNISEVADIVKKASFLNKTVKAIGNSHSASDIMCASGVLVPMQNFKKVIGLSKIGNIDVVETEAGVTVYELSEWLFERGYALAGLPHMGYRDVTVAGAIATGSHGSSTKHTGVISNILEAVTLVDGNGDIQYLERATADEDIFRALSTSLGLLGIHTSLKLRIQKKFNLEVKVTYHKDATLLTDGVINSVKDCDYGQLNWFPNSGKFFKTCGVKTYKKAFKGANNILLNPSISASIVKPFKKILQMGACYNSVMCFAEKIRWSQFKASPPIVYTRKNGKTKSARTVVGPAHRMVSSHLTKEQDGLFQMDWEIAVPASRAQDALLAIKRHTKKTKTCLPLVGVFIRFAPSESKSLLAHTHADGKDWIEGEPAVFFEMPVYVPVGLSDKKFAEYEKKFREFSAMLISDFSGRPHWAKNRQEMFDLVFAKGTYDQNLIKFQKAIDRLDPNGTFSNTFAKSLNLTWNKKTK